MSERTAPTARGEEGGVVGELLSLTRRTSELLWDLFGNADEQGQLIYPVKRDGRLRVSEQETRLLLAQIVENSTPWCYSVETPTTETYSQTGETPQSALSDMSLYRTRDVASKFANVELKHAGKTTVEDFRKDFEKLIRERVDSLWLHTLTSVNRGTFPSVFAKVYKAFARLRTELAGQHHSFVFSFCVLSQQRTWSNFIQLGGDADEQLRALDEFFCAARVSGEPQGSWTCYQRGHAR